MNNVNKTLYIPLYGKAYVSKKNIILEDKMAEKIWEAEGFTLKGKSKSKWLAYYMGIRSAVFDRWLKEKMNASENATILHLGCGMDSRIARVQNAAHTWYDIDFPEVIDERRKYYTEGNGYHMIYGDAREDSWLAKIPENAEAIVVMEGISMYLKNNEVAALFNALAKKFNKVSILMDAYSVFAAKMSKIKNPINDVGVSDVWGIDAPEAICDGCEISYLGQREMTPDELVNELEGLERKIFKKIYSGKMAERLYKIYEYRKD